MVQEGLALKVQSRGVDTTGLGWWCWQSFDLLRGGTTRVITAYQLVLQQDITREGAGYQQQWRFFIKHGESICPWEAWKWDLLQQLWVWQGRRESLILMADANKHVV